MPDITTIAHKFVDEKTVIVVDTQEKKRQEAFESNPPIPFKNFHLENADPVFRLSEINHVYPTPKGRKGKRRYY